MGAKLLIAFLAAATSCHKHYYGTSYDLSKKGRVIAWSIDEQGEKFRYTIDHLPDPILEGHIYDLTVGHGPIRAELPEPVDSVLVVLPPQPKPAQRKGADRIVEWIVSHDPGAATHIVIGPERWTRVHRIGQLEQGLAKLEERTADRLRQYGSTFGDALAASYIGSLAAGVVVVPVTHPKSRFVVVQINYAEGPVVSSLRTMSGAQASDYIVANYKMLAPELGASFPAAIHIVVAHDASSETHAACSDLGLKLSGRRAVSAPNVPLVVVYRTSTASQAELNARGAIKALAEKGELVPLEAGRNVRRAISPSASR